MQYFKLDPPHFVGDCMPFSHDGVFHVFYLLDEGHHQGLGGLGGHQWAHASSRDLVSWQHHPLAIPRDEDWEASICTGSVIFHGGQYHAFYASRSMDRTEALSHAVSDDGITFRKLTPNPFLHAPEGYEQGDCRDPFLFEGDDGQLHMLVTTRLADYPLHDRGGCLVRWTTADLREWQFRGVFLVPGGDAGYGCTPECSDYFYWNGWYYLIFGLGLRTHYRKSRNPFGPWQRPLIDTLGNRMPAVMKTAAWAENRRIGVGWVGPHASNTDTGSLLWAGDMVFREIVQLADGNLGTKFVPEMIPATSGPIEPAIAALTSGIVVSRDAVDVIGRETLEAAVFSNLGASFRLKLHVAPGPETYRFGIGLRGSGSFERADRLSFSADSGSVRLAGERIDGVFRPGEAFDLDIIVNGDLIDACIANRCCIIDRVTENAGGRIFLFSEGGPIVFDAIRASPIVK